jgi:hypothetical protein
MTLHQTAQLDVLSTMVAKVMAAGGCQAHHISPGALATSVEEGRHTKGTIGHDHDLEASRQQLGNLVEDCINLLPVVTLRLSNILLPERPSQGQGAALVAERDTKEVDLVGLRAVVDGEEDLARGSEEGVPVNDLMEDGGIAESRSEVGILKGTTEAAFDVLGTGGVGQVKVVEVSSDLFEDGGGGGKDASHEQSKASDGRAWEGGGNSAGDAVKHGLVQWVESRHGRSPG